MATDTLKIVCYTGGTCGDLIAAMIDPADSVFKNSTVMHSVNRQRLKKPHTFATDEEKDQFINEISTQYRSIPSHDLDYHVRRSHQFITITVQDFTIAHWAAKRFQALNRPQVWQEMQARCGASSIEHYAQTLIDYSNMVVNHTKDVVKLEDILAGHAINILQGMGMGNIDQDLYEDWLSLQNIIS